ncbi:unnamed protein product [Gongylonema pulchrum]|uniref:HEAT repeat-containing protein 1 n=1 Tax=Gongylonema pulchrum TaxID=637853 RepID=A0A183DT67_9BILA|nr:unnamed protein product [Gongylonema pulchrum]
MSAALLTRLETADTSADRLVLFDELCASTADCPDRLGSFLHFIQPAFCDPLRGVRSLAFQCARNYIAANPGMAEYFTSSYFMALLHNQADIALHALSVLPELVVVGRCEFLTTSFENFSRKLIISTFGPVIRFFI